MGDPVTQPIPAIAPRTVRTFAATVRAAWDVPKVWGWLSAPEPVRQAARNFATALELWADFMVEEQAKNRRRKFLRLVDKPTENLAHPGPECECSACLRDPANL